MRRLIAVVALLLVSACGGGPEILEPDPDETSASPEPTATPPEMPDVATEESPSGAVTYVQHWVNTFNFAQQTGSLEQLDDLSADSCTGCDAYMSVIAEIYEAGGHVDGGAWSMSNPEPQRIDEGARVFITVSREESQYKAGEESEPEISASGRDELVFTLDWSDERWTVSDLARARS